MKRPKDPVRETPRAVKETGRCPFCGGQLKLHCAGGRCGWVLCSEGRCAARGPEDGMVLP
jgi:hypothetical protein